ncbi:hypothetical protein KEJ49_07960, partial [Candidatus Bathyarchaeota archaeon]|nr:hypothetical protein [Candidatus Bathyarchaeota archaeon]
AILESPSTPMNITLAAQVKIILHLRPNPPSSVKKINVTLGFRNNETNYTLGEGSININSQGEYTLCINLLENQRHIPKNSVIVMKILVILDGPPYGTLFFYYGPDKPSRVILYDNES